jgi:hypothetical protein
MELNDDQNIARQMTFQNTEFDGITVKYRSYRSLYVKKERKKTLVL